MEKVKKWKKQEMTLDKFAKLGQGFVKETIESGCHIWYNLNVKIVATQQKGNVKQYG